MHVSDKTVSSFAGGEETTVFRMVDSMLLMLSAFSTKPERYGVIGDEI
jgi:hypothetical protein